jgi:hypothetical protein
MSAVTMDSTIGLVAAFRSPYVETLTHVTAADPHGPPSDRVQCGRDFNVVGISPQHFLFCSGSSRPSDRSYFGVAT